MNKRIAFILLFVLAMAGTKAGASTVDVATAQQFVAAVTANASAQIHLTADIDLSGVEFESAITFKGTIDGGYQTIGQDSKTENRFRVIKGFEGVLFYKLEGATIQNITIEGVTGEYSGNGGEGMLCCEATNATVQNVYFHNCKMEDDNLMNSCSNMGFVAGRATGSTFTNVRLYGCTIDMDGSCIGGLVGQTEACAFSLCLTDPTTRVRGEGDPNGNVGGIVGYANGGSLTDTYNYATVSGGDMSDHVGGLCGSSNGTNYTRCQHVGAVMQVSDSQWDAIGTTLGATILTEAATGIAGSEILLLISWNDLVWWGDLEASALAALSSQFVMLLGPAVVLTALDIAYLIYSFNSPDEVGGIVGYAQNGTLSQCINSGTLFCLDAYCGGIAGYAEKCTLTDCLNDGFVKGDEQTGGIVGYVDQSTVQHCLGVGHVEAESETVGAIYGDGSNGTFVNNYYRALADEATPLTTINKQSRRTLASGQTAVALNGEGRSVWRQDINQTTTPAFCDLYPWPISSRKEVGATGNQVNANAPTYTVVSNAKQLRAAITDRNADIYLNADIDLAGVTPNWCSLKSPFRGTIEGNGHSITGLTMSATGEDTDGAQHVGLFTYAEGATFQHLNIQDCNFTGAFFVGALVGSSKNCHFTDVHLTGTSKVKCWGDYVGGLVGESDHDQFLQCSTAAGTDVFSDGYSLSSNAIAGGIAGGATGSRFERCIHNGKVWGDDDRIGGIVGEAITSTFVHCVNNGTVRTKEDVGGYDDEVGGIAAYSEGCTFDGCINNGTVLAADAYCGGIVGLAEKHDNTSTIITNCLISPSSSVSADEQVGGICGSLNDSRIQNCLVMKGNLCGEQDGSTLTNNYCKGTQFKKSNSCATVTTAELGSGKVGYWLNGSNVQVNNWRQNLETDNPSYPYDAYPTVDVETEHQTLAGSLAFECRHITTADELIAFSALVAGNDPKGMLTDAVLDNDIDMTGKTWTPIGDATHPYKGHFDGQGHTIRNLQYTSSENRLHGFFGVVGVGVVIENLVIDSSCSFTASQRIVAGVVGGAEESNATGDITLRNLLCQATVSSTGSMLNTAGIIAGVYGNDNQRLVMTHCGFTGSVNVSGGGKEAAALCGYARHNAVITHCWAAPTTLQGTQDNNYLVRKGNNCTLTNCYITRSGDASATYITPEKVQNGELCWRLNGSDNLADEVTWYQNLGYVAGDAKASDATPVLDATHDRVFSILTTGDNRQQVSAHYGTSTVSPYSAENPSEPIWINSAITPKMIPGTAYNLDVEILFEKGIDVQPATKALTTGYWEVCLPYHYRADNSGNFEVFDVMLEQVANGTVIEAGTSFYVKAKAGASNVCPTFPVADNVLRPALHCTYKQMDTNSGSITVTYAPDGSETKVSYKLIGGTYYEISGASLVSGNTMTFPETILSHPVTRIHEYAIRNKSNVRHLVIPASIEYIGNNNFDHFSNLQKVTFADGTANCHVGYNYGTWSDDELFYECGSLSEVYLGRNLVRLTENDHYGDDPDDGSEELPFADVSSLRTVTVGPKVTTLPKDLFDDAGVTTVNIIGETAQDAPLKNMAEFSHCSSVYLDRDLTSGSLADAFEDNCTSVAIGPHCTAIPGGNMFGSSVTRLDLLQATSLKSIGDNAFDGCHDLQFVRQDNTTNLSFSSAICLETIGKEAFYGCYMANCSELKFPATLKTLGEGAFDGGAWHGGSDHDITKIDLSLCTQLTTIPKNAFYGCEDLSSLLLPTGLRRIEEQAFDNCENLKTVSLPATLEYIGEAAFFDNAFTSLLLPASVTFIGEDAFDRLGTSYNTIVEVRLEGAPGAAPIAIDDAANFVKATTVYLDRDLDNGYPTNSCNGGYRDNVDPTSSHSTPTFDVCFASAKTVTVGPNVTTIGKHAFGNFVETLDLANATSLTTIGEQAFAECPITTLTLPASLTSMGQFAFFNCTQLKSLYGMENTQLTTIPYEAFLYDPIATPLTLPEGLTQIDRYAFYGSQFTTLSLPSTLKSIDMYAFDGAKKLTSVTFHSYPLIWNWAFNHETFSGNDYSTGEWKMVLTDASYLYFTDNQAVAKAQESDAWLDGIPGSYTSVTYTRPMANALGSLVLPFDVTVSGSEAYTLYRFNAVGENGLSFDAVHTGKIDAGTPVLVRRTAAADGISITASGVGIKSKLNEVKSGSWTLKGTYVTRAIGTSTTTHDYYIAGGQLWYASQEATVGPYRAWLEGPAYTPDQSAISLRFSDTTLVEGMEATPGTATVYDLQGRPVTNPMPGQLYIVAGKKVLFPVR